MSELVWMSPTEVLAVMEQQVAQTNREELNEIGIIKRFIDLYEVYS